MKKLLKRGIALALAVATIGMAAPQSAAACIAKDTCYSTNEYSTCSSVNGRVTGTHIVIAPNGNASACTIFEIAGYHAIRCSGCSAKLRTEYRICSERHSNSHCYDRYSMCK